MNAASLIRSLTLASLFGAATSVGAASLQFSNVEADDVGRVEIRVDGPETPADIGATDFTLEFWMRSASGNSAGALQRCNDTGYNWIEGNIVFDRDRLATNGRDYGLAIAGGVIVFGVENSGNSNYTICGSTNVLNGQWRHVAVQRRSSDGQLSLYIDGVLDVQRTGPTGDISYPNGQQSDPKEPLLVIGREKYDLGPDGFRGWIDEVRLSRTLRYSGNFSVPSQPFTLDANTAALYHFDEGSGDTIVDQNGNESPGVRRFSSTAGPQWSTETPFTGGAGTVQFAAATYSVAENGGSITVSATRTGGSSGAATVDIAVTGGTATSGADYQFTPATLSWAAGESGTKTATITVLDDADVESNETVVVSLSNATGAALGTPSSTTTTISDNDVPPSAGTLQFSSSTYSVSEGTATLAITVSRTGGSAGAASVSVGVTGGTATSGSDYQFTPVTLSWAAGQSTSQTATLTLLDDSADESNETVVLGLSNATGATLGSPSSATATITDNDPAPSAGTLQFSSSTYSIGEGGGTLTVSVSRSGGTSGAASVAFNLTGGTATQGTDFQLAPATLSWPDGQGGSRSFTVTITNDTAVEGNETILVGLSTAIGAALGSPASATITIADNDNAGTMQFASAASSVSESATTLSISVTRTGGAGGAASVAYSVSGGTAMLNTDYQLSSGTVTWASGENGTRTFSLIVVPDTTVEGDETISIELFNPTGATLGSPTTTVITLTDDDNGPAPTPGALQFSASSYSVDEGGGTLTVSVVRSGGSAGAASVNVAATGGSATAGSDYSFNPQTLQWADGESGARTFDIATMADSTYEGDETIALALSNATGAQLGATTSAAITITDDDPAPAGALNFSAATYTVNEADGTFVIGVTRSEGSAGNASVTVSAAGGTATSADYQLSTTTLTWAAGESGERTVSGSLTNDASVEQDETIVVELSNAVGANLGTVTATTVTIRDNDVSQPPPTDGGGGGGGGALGAWWIAAGLFAIAARRRRLLSSVRYAT